VEVEEGALFVDRGGITYRLDGFDDIVLCVGTVPNGELVTQLRAAGLDVRPVGDCTRARTIFDAVREGFEAAYSL